MLMRDQICLLKALFPEEALRADTNRGFALTRINAAHVIRRLNDAFGPCASDRGYSGNSPGVGGTRSKKSTLQSSVSSRGGRRSRECPGALTPGWGTTPG